MCTTFATTQARRRLALDATLAQLAAEGFSERQISEAMWDCARLTDPEAEREAAYAAEVYGRDFSTHMTAAERAKDRTVSVSLPTP